MPPKKKKEEEVATAPQKIMSHEQVIATAINSVMQTVGYVQKKDRNQFQKYNYAGEAALLAALRPAMVQIGLVLLPSQKAVSPIDEYGNVFVTIDYTLLHAPTGAVYPHPLTAVGCGNDKNSKGGVGDKGLYKAITGANKYMLFKLFQLETGDDAEATNTEPVAPTDDALVKKYIMGVHPGADETSRSKRLELLNLMLGEKCNSSVQNINQVTTEEWSLLANLIKEK